MYKTIGVILLTMMLLTTSASAATTTDFMTYIQNLLKTMPAPTTTVTPTPTPTPVKVIDTPSNGSPVVTRSITYGVGTVTVTLTPSNKVNFDAPGWYAIEHIPAGFTFVNTDTDWKKINGTQWDFMSFMSPAPMKYTMKMPSTPGEYTITGTFKDDWRRVNTTIGTTIITVS